MSGFDMTLGGLAALLVGFSKTGVPGTGMLTIPLMAEIFPAKESVGALLPMLICGDIFALYYYNRHAQWTHLWGLFPWVAVGMVPAAFVLRSIDSETLRPFLGGLVLTLIILEAIRKRAGWTNVPHAWWFTGLMGFLAGFTTTVGNAAVPIMIIYLLSKDLPKEQFMGTGAWYFFLVNSSKVPIYAIIGIITTETLTFDLMAAPVIVVGALIGARVLKVIPQSLFNATVNSLAALAALRMVFF